LAEETPVAADNSLVGSFNRESIDKARRDARLAAITACAAFPAFSFLDYFVYRQFLLIFSCIRLTVIALSLVVYSLTGTKLGRRNPRGLGMAEYLICCLSVVIMIHVTGDSASPYYVGIITILMIFLVMMPLDVKRTSIISVIVYLAYLVPTLALRRVLNLPLLLNNNFFLLLTIVLVILSSHLATKMRFREFSARYNLAKANEELRKLDVLKSQFFANVSHEVRTPLTSILSPIQSMYQGDMGPLAPEHQQLIGQVYRNTLKLLDMINQMLDFSKFEAGKMQLRLKQVDLDELAQDVASTFEDVSERKGLKLRYVSESELKPIFLDFDKVERILTNLVRNAIKFTESGSITVKTGTADKVQWVEVRDTGIGIPTEHQPSIFKRFQQVDSSSTRKYEGTGLGLTIVKEAVDLLRGRITVQSEEQRGSTFRVELPDNLEQLVPDTFIDRRAHERRRPVAEFQGWDKRRLSRRETDKVTIDDLALLERDMLALKTAVPQPDETPSQARADRILLAEDNVDLRSYISRMLARFGYKVSTAIDGLDAWEQAQTQPPDVVISDVMMPRMDGYELVQRIKSTEKTRHVPVILITAKLELESKIQGLEKGADDYLPKPINIRELDARIHNLISTRNFQQALVREAELSARMEELSMSFSQSLEIRDSNTAGHSRDVLNLGSILAEGLGIRVDRTLRDSLLLHDIGKLGIPDRILLKESPLNEEEWGIMRKHPELGANLLGHFESYREISSIILAHQEHFDGTGYPNRLQGERIPLFARIVAIADAFHAMTSNRPYRKALSPKLAVLELVRNRGTQFDGELVDGFVAGLLKHKMISAADVGAFERKRT